jgi:hypothetical protein
MMYCIAVAIIFIAIEDDGLYCSVLSLYSQWQNEAILISVKTLKFLISFFDVDFMVEGYDVYFLI